MADTTEKKIKVILPDGTKGNIPESKLDIFKKKYPQGQTLGYMDGTPMEIPKPVEPAVQQPISISDASMPTDSVLMMNNTTVGSNLPPVDANNAEIQAQEYAQQQIKANTEDAYQRVADRAKGVFEEGVAEQVRRNTFDTENKEGKSFFRRLAEFTGNIAPRSGNRATFHNDAYLSNTEFRDYADAMDKLQDAKNLIKDAEKEESGTFVGGFGRGASRGTFDIDTWTSGVSQSLKSQNLQDAVTKFEKGEELTPAEEALLESSAINAAVMALYQNKLGRGYKAGKVTAESIPFMMEMMANPASGFGRSMSNRLARYALSRGMGRASTKAMSYAGRVGADIIGANLMSLSTGSGRVVGGAIDRELGQMNYALDEDGAIKFIGVEGGEDSFAKALRKSYTANTITNFSEMLGMYFAPMSGLVGNGISKFTKHFPKLKKVEDVIKTMNNSDMARYIRQFDRESQLSGVFGEFTEEIADGVLNTIFVGDQTISDVFDKDNLIDTLLGVSFFGGMRTALKTVEVAKNGFNLIELYKERAEKEARRSGIDENTWNYEKGKIDTFSSDEYMDDGYKELISYLNQRSIDDAFTQQQKVALFNYAKAVQQTKGISLVTQKAVDEGVDTYESAEPSDIQQDIQEKSPLEPTDEELFLSSLQLSPADDIRYRYEKDGKKYTDNTVRPIKFKQNGQEYDGYLIRETSEQNGLTPSAEVVYIADPQTGKAEKGVISSRDITERLNPIQDEEFFNSTASLLREQRDKEVKAFETRNEEAIEGSMTPEERIAYRQSKFNEIIRDNPDYDKGVYDSAFNSQGEERANLTEEQMFVVNKQENGLEQAVSDIFYQKGIQESKIAKGLEKEAKMRAEGRDIRDIRKEQKKRKIEQSRLEAIDKIIEERGLVAPEAMTTQAPQQTGQTMVPYVVNTLEQSDENISQEGGQEQQPQSLLENIEGVLDGEREASERVYIDSEPVVPVKEVDRFTTIYNEIPRDKNGDIKESGLTLEQQYARMREEHGSDVANEALSEELQKQREKLAKETEKLSTTKGMDKSRILSQITKIRSSINEIQAIANEASSTPIAGTETVAVQGSEGAGQQQVLDTQPENVATQGETTQSEVAEVAEVAAAAQEEPIPQPTEEVSTPVVEKADKKAKEKPKKQTKAKALPKNMKELKTLSGEELKETLVQMMQKGLIKFGSRRSWVDIFGERMEKVKDVNALMKKINPSYEPQKKLYLAVRDLKSIVKGTETTEQQSEETATPEVEKKEDKTKEKPTKDKKQKKSISLAELRAMSQEELKNTLIQLAQDKQIKILRKNKGVRISNVIYSKGVIDELLKKIDPEYEATQSVYNTKQKFRDVAQMNIESTDTPTTDEATSNAEESIIDDSENKEDVYITYKGKEVTLQSLIDTYKNLYDAIEKNKKKAKTAIGDIAKKYIPQEMKAISDFLEENGIDRSVLDSSAESEQTKTKKAETKKTESKQAKPQESENVVEEGYEIVEVTKNGKKEKRVMLDQDDYLRRRVYWKRDELKKAKKASKSESELEVIEDDIKVLNKTAQERGIKSTKDARKGDAALADEYANSPYGKREIAYYNDNQKFEFDVIEQPKHKSNWIPQNIKKMAMELVKEIPNLNSETTTQKGTSAMRKVDDKNNLFVRVNNNGIAEYYYGTEKQPKSELFRPIEYDQRILTKQEKDFTKESIDSYIDYLSAGEQIKAIKVEGLKINEKKEALAQRNTIRQKRDQWKKEHKDEIKEWQSRSSMRFERSKPKSNTGVEGIGLSAEDMAAIEEAESGEINLDEGQGELFNPADYRFQVSSKGSSGTRRATISEVQKLSDAISSVFPRGYAKVKILSDKKFNEQRAKTSGSVFHNNEGDICGYIGTDGVVYINQDKARIDTPLHEIGIHRLVDLAKETKNTDMLRTVIEYAKSAPQEIIEEVKEMYPDLDPRKDVFWEEVAAKAFGIQNEGRLEALLQTEAQKSWWKKLVEAVKKLWNKITNEQTMYKDMSLYQGLSRFGHEEIGNRLFDMLTSEGVINLGQVGSNRGSIARDMFVGEKANINKDYLDMAKKMEEQGQDALTIKKTTGWEKGADGKWRYEIEDVRLADSIIKMLERESIDTGMILNDKLESGEGVYLSDILKGEQILEMYPSLRNIRISIEDRDGEAATGSYNPNTKRIWVSDTRNIDGTFIHELQHAIQEIEGFAKGGNLNVSNSRIDEAEAELTELVRESIEIDEAINDLEYEEWSLFDEYVKATEAKLNRDYEGTNYNEEDIRTDEEINHLLVMMDEFTESIAQQWTSNYIDTKFKEEEIARLKYESYRNLAGEVEARNSSKRMDLTPEQRRNTLAESTEDTPRDQQIIFFGGDNNSFSVENNNISQDIPNTDELINGILTRKGEERAQISARSASAIDSALRDANCPNAAHPSAWIDYFSRKGAIDTKNRGGLGEHLYEWLSSQNSMKVIKKNDIVKKNKEKQFKNSPFERFLGKSADRFRTYFIDADQSIRDIQEEVERLSGVSQLDITEDFVKNHNLESSRIASNIERYEESLQKDLEGAYDTFAKYNSQFESDSEIGLPYQDAVDRYLFALHAPERNRKINIDNLVDAAMEYAKSIDLPKTGLELELRLWITKLYDNEFVGKNGVSLTEFSDNINSKWTREAKRVEKKVLVDFAEVVRDNNQSGENLTDSEAAKYVTAFEAIVEENEITALNKAVKASTNYILDSAYNSGLISAGTYNTYKRQYKNYIPLRSWENEESMDAKERTDKSYFTGISSVTGEAEVEKKAKGRKTAAASPLATLLMEVQDTAVRGERNRTLNALVNLFNNHRLETHNMIYVSNTEDIDKDALAPAWVREMSKQNAQEGIEHIVGVKINGENRRIYIAGDTGKRFVNAYKNLDAQETGFMKRSRVRTKYISRLLTTLNPTFWISNTERDVSGGIRNMYILRDAEYSRDLISNLASSFKEAFDANVRGAETDMYKLYLDNGGSISYYKQKETKDIVKEVKEKADNYIKNGVRENKAFYKALFETTADLASVTEEMTRYAAFKTAVQHGESPAEAAYLAHEVTTNLSRRGSQRLFSNLYSFFNPTVQGVNQMVTFFASPKTRKKAVVAYGADMAYFLTTKVAMMAITAAIYNADKDDDDEKIGVFDKENPYWNIAENIRLNTVAIPIGIDENGIPKCLVFQRPHQYRAFSSIVDYGLEAMSGNINGEEFVNKYLKRMIAETAPFNSASYNDGVFLGLAQQFTPSFIRPLMDVAVNANAFGTSIRRDQYDKSQPEYLLGKGSGIKPYTSISKALNALGDGSSGIRGAWLQVNADDIKYLVESYTGFAGRLTHDVVNSATRIDAEKERYGNSFANIFGNIYWENKDGAMYQASDKLREYADKYVANLLNNPNPNLVKEFVNDPKTMERITDEATLVATEMYSEYSKVIKELENAWNIVLSDETMSIEEQNKRLQKILDGIVEVNTKLGKSFEDELNDIIKNEDR